MAFFGVYPNQIEIMLQTSTSTTPISKPELPFAEFVSLVALMMAITALSLDIMLPALGVMGEALGLAAANDRQLIITFYLVGFSTGQIFFGPLSDRFGRKPPLYAGLTLFIIGSILAALAETSTAMFAARALQGIGAASPRIIGMAIIRDRFAGRGMARVMSFVMMIFLATPILAPTIGQILMQFGSWRLLFAILMTAGVLNIVWLKLRLPETAAEDQRLPLSPKRIGAAIGIALTTRQTVGYAVSFGFMFGILMSYIGSAEQIFIDVYDVGVNFPLYFAAIASVMIPAALINTQLVGRIGMRRMSHFALLAMLGSCALMAIAGYPPKPPLFIFCLYMASVFFCFGLIGPNFNSMAMEKVGNIAGTASSLIGFYATGAGAIFGFLVGQAFDHTIRPLTIGFTILGLLALAAVLVTERGKLAQPQHAEPPEH
jgi:DHA1 family bicyclomycin/chloramphenicol resistance-like MFS transporter